MQYRWRIKGTDASGLPLKYEVWKPGHTGLSANASGNADSWEDCMELVHGVINTWEKQRIHDGCVSEGVIEVPKADAVPDTLPEDWS